MSHSRTSDRGAAFALAQASARAAEGGSRTRAAELSNFADAIRLDLNYELVNERFAPMCAALLDVMSGPFNLEMEDLLVAQLVRCVTATAVLCGPRYRFDATARKVACDLLLAEAKSGFIVSLIERVRANAAAITDAGAEHLQRLSDDLRFCDAKPRSYPAHRAAPRAHLVANSLPDAFEYPPDPEMRDFMTCFRGGGHGNADLEWRLVHGRTHVYLLAEFQTSINVCNARYDGRWLVDARNAIAHAGLLLDDMPLLKRVPVTAARAALRQACRQASSIGGVLGLLADAPDVVGQLSRLVWPFGPRANAQPDGELGLSSISGMFLRTAGTYYGTEWWPGAVAVEASRVDLDDVSHELAAAGFERCICALPTPLARVPSGRGAIAGIGLRGRNGVWLTRVGRGAGGNADWLVTVPPGTTLGSARDVRGLAKGLSTLGMHASVALRVAWAMAGQHAEITQVPLDGAWGTLQLDWCERVPEALCSRAGRGSVGYAVMLRWLTEGHADLADAGSEAVTVC